MIVGGWESGGRKGEPVGGCYVAVELVGWLVGLHWRVGDAWSRWSHMCRSWSFPRNLFRGVLYMDQHSLLDGPGMAVDFLVHYVELVRVHGVSCGCTVEVYRGGGL